MNGFNRREPHLACRFQRGGFYFDYFFAIFLVFRYQLCENIRVLRLLLPIVMCVFLLDCSRSPNEKNLACTSFLSSSHTSIIMVGAVAFLYFDLAGFPKELYPIFEVSRDALYNKHKHKCGYKYIYLSRNSRTRSIWYIFKDWQCLWFSYRDTGLWSTLVAFKYEIFRRKRSTENQMYATNMSTGLEYITAHDLVITKGW